MSNSPDFHRIPPKESQDAAVRKPYRKPALRLERLFETKALQCGKVFSDEDACNYNRNAS